MDDIVILITTPTLKEARRISRVLIETKKAACCNIIKNVESLFYWQDKLRTATEVLIIAKSTKRKFKDIVKITKKYHSCEVPEIIALPIKLEDKAYRDWMRKILR